VLFALVQAAPHSHALSGQRHRIAPSWSFASDFPGLGSMMRASRGLPGPRTRVSCCTFRAPMHGRHRSLAPQPRVCREVRLHNTATSPNLTLDPLYWYMRPFELARTVNVRSSFWDSTTAHYIDLPCAASLWVWVASLRALPAVFHRVGRRANNHAQVLDPCLGHCDTACRCRARLT